MAINTKKGLNGWLSPSGEFFPCEHGEHWEFAHEMMQKNNEILQMHAKSSQVHGHYAQPNISLQMNGYSCMSSKGVNYNRLSNVYVPADSGLTEAQVKWYREHLDELDENQIELLQVYAEEIWEKENQK